MSTALVLADSAPVTQWGPRLLLTLATLALIGLGAWGMWVGWRRREARQADVAVPPTPPADLVLDEAAAVPGLYVATTTADDLLDRIVAHGLGYRGRATLAITPAGVLIERVGEVPVWIPAASLRDVRLGSGQAQKAFESGGLILIRWQLGDREVETGFRADRSEQHIATAAALRGLVQTAGGAA
jgi:hypothetical protein